MPRTFGEKRMIRSNRLNLLVAIACVIIAIVLTVVLVKGVISHAEEHTSYVTALEYADTIDNEVENEVLLARAFLLPNYDKLATSSREAGLLCARLATPPDVRQQARDPFREAHQRYCREIDAKLAAVERFKVKNAVVRNSLKYLGTIEETFRGLPYDLGFQHLYSDLLAYSLDASADNYAEAQHHVRQLGHSPPPAIQTVLQHARLVLFAVRERSDIEKTIFSGNSDKAMRSMREIYLREYRDQESIAFLYRLCLFSLTFLAVALLLALFLHLHSTKEKLAALNESLESRVAQRTAELREALSELENKQTQLLHASKMSALGEMAGGIAHEINSPLAAISLNAEIIEGALPADSPVVASARTILSTVTRISKIITGLRRFARSGPKDPPVRVSAGSIIADSLSFCGEKMKNSFIDLQRDTTGDAEEVLCQPEQMTQVLLNLLNNAVDAVSKAEKKWVRVRAERRENKIRLSVEDSGPPIPSAIREKIMQPFFTTKEAGKGTGLGLSISHGIVAAHGGKLWLDPQSAHTRFVVELPAA